MADRAGPARARLEEFDALLQGQLDTLHAVAMRYCRNSANGCVPLNVFGAEGSITQPMLDFVNLTGLPEGEPVWPRTANPGWAFALGLLPEALAPNLWPLALVILAAALLGVHRAYWLLEAAIRQVEVQEQALDRKQVEEQTLERTQSVQKQKSFVLLQLFLLLHHILFELQLNARSQHQLRV